MKVSTLNLEVQNILATLQSQFLLDPSATFWYPGSYGGGGALTLQGSTGICYPQDHPFKAIFCSRDPPFQAPVQLQKPHLYTLIMVKII